ncbi:MAG: hypothetical protein ACKN9F_01805 [Methylomonas sp.]
MRIFTPRRQQIVCLLALVTGSAIAADHNTVSIDKSAVKAIEFNLAEDNLQQFGFKLTAKSMAERVKANLTEWHYPFQAIDGAYSHRLQAKLGKVSHQATPVGFSFTSGSSDPRSPDFQKADVLPITCTLSKIGDANQTIEQHSSFGIHQFIDQPSEAKLNDKLVDQISTACFNLLDELRLPSAVGNNLDSKTFKPTWMPEVKVEVKQVPVVNSTNLDAGAQSANEETRKEIIIHNQGTPLILNFGHERR